MLSQGTTYDRVHAACAAIVAVCNAEGVDPIELTQGPLDDGFLANVITPWIGEARENMLACGAATPRALEQIDHALTLADAETILCLTTLAVRGK